MQNLIKVISSLLVLSLFSSSFAMADDNEHFKQIENRKLLVIIKKENPAHLKYYQKRAKKNDHFKNKIVEYKANIESYNKTIKDAVENYWGFDNPVEYMSYKEMKDLKRSQKKQYVCLMFDSPYELITEEARHPILKLFYADKKSVKLLEFYKNDTINRVDLVYGIQQFNSHLNLVMQGKLTTKYKSYKNLKANVRVNPPLYKDKVLLIKSEDLHSSLSAESIAKLYPHAFEIVSEEKFEQALFEKDDIYALLYVKFVAPVELNNLGSIGAIGVGLKYGIYNQKIINAADGRILSFSSPLTPTPGYDKVKEKNIKDLLKKYDQ